MLQSCKDMAGASTLRHLPAAIFDRGSKMSTINHPYYHKNNFPRLIWDRQGDGWRIYADMAGHCAAIPREATSGRMACAFGVTSHIWERKKDGAIKRLAAQQLDAIERGRPSVIAQSLRLCGFSETETIACLRDASRGAQWSSEAINVSGGTSAAIYAAIRRAKMERIRGKAN